MRVVGWGRSAILQSKENMIGNAAGGPLGDRMISCKLRGNYSMDICQNDGTSLVGSVWAFPELPTDKGRA